MYRIGTTSATTYTLEDCSGCGLAGWGWQDNAYGTGALGPAIYFNTSGQQRLRVQVREDGLGIDQIVLSARTYLSKSPGTTKNDTTILTAPDVANMPPTTHLTSPGANAHFTAPATIAMVAEALDSDGTVTRVEFLANGDGRGLAHRTSVDIHLDRRGRRFVFTEYACHRQPRRHGDLRFCSRCRHCARSD